MKIRWLVALGGAAFVLTLILTAPAATLYGLFASADTQTVPVGLSGTARHGRMDALLIDGRPVLGSTSWQLRLRWLPLGRIKFNVVTAGPVAGGGEVGVSAFGRLTLRNMRLSGDVKPLLDAAGYPFLPVEARGALELARVTANGRQLREVDGRVQLQGLIWTLGRNRMQLGDFEALLETDGNAQVARISALQGPLDVSGHARLSADRAYELDLRLRPKPGADPQVANMIRALGRPDAQGYYPIRQQGQLQ